MNSQAKINLQAQFTQVLFNNGILKQELARREQIINNMTSQNTENIQRMDSLLDTLTNRIEEKDQQIEEKDQQIEQKETKIRDLEEIEKQQKENIEELTNQHNTLKADHNLKLSEIMNLDDKIKMMREYEKQLKDSSIDQSLLLKGTLKEKTREIEQKESEFKILDAALKDMVNENKKMKEEYEGKINKMKETCENTINELTSQYDKKMKNMVEDFNKQMKDSNLRSNHIEQKTSAIQDTLTSKITTAI